MVGCHGFVVLRVALQEGFTVGKVSPTVAHLALRSMQTVTPRAKCWASEVMFHGQYALCRSTPGAPIHADCHAWCDLVGLRLHVPSSARLHYFLLRSASGRQCSLVCSDCTMQLQATSASSYLVASLRSLLWFCDSYIGRTSMCLCCCVRMFYRCVA